ncbi:MAG: ammonium transporter [Thermoleophilaceae bacterium]|nr:ammonium transporter [Thermoleophilaceae bacterium]
MKFSRLGALGLLCTSIASLLLLPTSALAQTTSSAASNSAIDTLWVLICAFLVIFMLTGFAALEVGLVRGKNAGSIIAKVLLNAAIATVAFWAVGFAIGFGGDGDFFGTTGFFLSGFSDPLTAFPAMAASDASIYAKFLFQYGFAAVVLAIAVGPLVERVKFGVYIIFGLIFCGVIYPVAAHWVYGGGFLQQWGMEDFAGSTAVHLVGASAGLAGVLLLGPRRGKYRDGVSRPIPGHSMPMFGVGILILWFGWFGFNAGSTFQALGVHFAEVAVVTNLSVACGVIGATITNYIIEKDYNIAMIGNGAIAGAVAITAPSGYVEPWAAVPIGLVGGTIVVIGLNWIDDKIDDPIGAITAHGMVGIWGTIAAGIFAVPRFAEKAGVGVKDGEEFIGGLVYSGSFQQLGVQLAGIAIVATFVFASSLAVFAAIKYTIGLRVSDEEEDAGLDISDHGMYGYPEIFIPPSELADPGLPLSSGFRHG